MNYLRKLVSLIILSFFLCYGFAQNPADIEIKIDSVSQEVYVLFGSGGNIGISSGEDGVLIIDSQFGELADRIKAEIKKINKGPVKFLCNTNWHYDHVRGNEAFARDGTIIIAHKLTRSGMMETMRQDSGKLARVYPDIALPTVLIDNSMTMHFNGDEIEIQHIANAHSDADLMFIFKNANVIHTGDLCFNAGYPYIDVAKSGSIDGMIRAADHIISLMDKETKVIPGHGQVMDIDDVKAYRKMLSKIRKEISGLIENGKSIDEIIAAKPTANYDKTNTLWVPADNFVKIVYNSLVK